MNISSKLSFMVLLLSVTTKNPFRCDRRPRECEVKSDSDCGSVYSSSGSTNECDLNPPNCFERREGRRRRRRRSLDCGESRSDENVVVVCNPGHGKKKEITIWKIFELINYIYNETLKTIERIIEQEFDELSQSINLVERKSFSKNVAAVKSCFDSNRKNYVSLINKTFERLLKEINRIINNSGLGEDSKAFITLKHEIERYVNYLLTLDKNDLFNEVNDTHSGTLHKLLGFINKAEIENTAEINKQKHNIIEEITRLIKVESELLLQELGKIIDSIEQCIISNLSLNSKKQISANNEVINKSLKDLLKAVSCALGYSEKEALKLLKVYLCTGTVPERSFKGISTRHCYEPRSSANRVNPLEIFDDESYEFETSSSRNNYFPCR